MTKRRLKKRNNFLYQKNEFQFSNLIGVLLLVCLILTFSLKFYIDHNSKTSPFINNEESVEKQHSKFIQVVGPYAKQMQRQYGVLPSITISQAILESDWGNSTLSQKCNNYFGIKAIGNEPSDYFKTKEFVNGRWISITARFKVYNSWQDSVRDHTLLLFNGTKWNPNQYQQVIMAKNYQDAARALYKAQYATDPDYPEKLIELIQKYNLDNYDN